MLLASQVHNLRQYSQLNTFVLFLYSSLGRLQSSIYYPHLQLIGLYQCFHMYDNVLCIHLLTLLGIDTNLIINTYSKRSADIRPLLVARLVTGDPN